MNKSHPMNIHGSISWLPGLALAGALFVQLASADSLPNAWQITDNSGAGGSTLNYTTNLTLSQHQAATNSGFLFTVQARFSTNFGGSKTMAMVYGLGSKRFLIWFDVNTNGDLTADLEGGLTYTLTTNGTGSALYHTHEIIYTNGAATYKVDGAVVTNNWLGSATPFAAGQVSWGASASAGQGEMNFHAVTFDINGLGVVAAYNACSAGNPLVSPDPTTRGWTVNPLVPAPGIFVRPVAVDGIGPLPNAWQITDNSAASLLNYTTNLPDGLRIAATNIGGGFRFKVNARLVNDFGGPKTMAMGYGLGNDRFFIWWRLNGNGDLTAELEGTTTLTLTANGTGAALYHTHEMVYNPTNQKCTYLFDGQVMNANWAKSANNLTAGQVYWGAASSAGVAQMNFNRATFEVTNTVVAEYYAGTQRNPALAPNPTNQNWTLNGTSANGSGVSPDTALLPVATTLAANQFLSTSAQLNGQAIASGSPTTAWFEWGTGMNYGNVTTNLDIGNGLSTNGLNFVIGGLSGGPIYHYRLVASNAFGIVSGANKSFNLSFLDVTPGGPNSGADSFVAWGDYDRDGDLDFLFLTDGGDPPTSLIQNRPIGFFGSASPSLDQAVKGCAAWGDYDNDGRLDFLLTGADATNGLVSQVWQNTSIGSGTTFSNVTASVAPGLPGVYFSSVAWGDYDNDGQLDFLLTGTTNGSGSGAISQLWRNTGSGFSNVTASVAPSLPLVLNSSVAWGDFDNDGRLDFLLTGTTNGTKGISQLWRNTGSGFSNVTASVASGLPGVAMGSVAWGDYDNDGRLDFLLTGTTDGSRSGVISQLWRNTGSGFSNVTASVAPGLLGVYKGSVAWGDYDHDGRLDILITGDGITSNPGIWKNNLPISNAPPAAPAGLSATFVGTNITLSWNASTDDHTPADGLNYNVRIGTTPGGLDVVSPHALTNGTRSLPQIGNAGPDLTAFYNLPPDRTYYWSVQAVDTGYAGSPFAVEQQFTIAAPRIIDPLMLGNGQFRFSFTNQSSVIYEVLGTTNVALPLNQWSVLGLPASLGGGLYQFTNAVAPNEPRRFYLLHKQ